jgi:hypothetical protein
MVMNDNEIYDLLTRRSNRFRRAYASDRGSVNLIMQIAREKIRPNWIDLDNNDPVKSDILSAVRQDVAREYKLRRQRESKSILGSILLGVVVNLIVRAILGMMA